MSELVSKLNESLGEARLAHTATSFHCRRADTANSPDKKGRPRGTPIHDISTCVGVGFMPTRLGILQWLSYSKRILQ
jgi:hypothetical protein